MDIQLYIVQNLQDACVVLEKRVWRKNPFTISKCLINIYVVINLFSFFALACNFPHDPQNALRRLHIAEEVLGRRLYVNSYVAKWQRKLEGSL